MPKKRTFPNDTRFGCYFLSEEPGGFTIRQRVVLPDGEVCQPRYPRNKYKHLNNSREVFQAFVDKLNYGLDLKEQRALEIQTAFIPQKMMDSFFAQLQTEIPNQKDFRYCYNTAFQRYFLDFFIGRLLIPDPREWIKRQSDWGAALTSKSKNPQHNIFEQKVSVKTLKTTIQIANRFMKFLHIQMPEDYPQMEFQPLSKSALKTYAAELELERDDGPVGRYVKDEDWKIIEEKLPKRFGCFIKLMYYYGLRRAESLGFDDLNAVRKNSVKITKQLRTKPETGAVYGPLKDKEKRDTPHWFLTPDRAYRLIEEGLDKKMHPDTLSDMWDEFISGLGMDYETHDFRRTFITKALRKYAPRDVQLAVGHANLSTTMKYAQDDRNLGDEIWKPAS